MRTRSGILRFLVGVAAITVITSLTSCAYPNLDATVVGPAVGTTSPPGSTLGHGATSLSCAQGSDGMIANVDSALDGRIGLDLLSTDPWSTVPLARDVNLTVPADQDWLFRKSPITITAGTESVTVSVPDDGKQFLAWVPFTIWTDGTTPNLTQWSQTSITIQPCPDRAATFLGGVLALTSDHCFTLRFQSESGLTDDRHVRLDGEACGP